jgi:hypothetical protein
LEDGPLFNIGNTKPVSPPITTLSGARQTLTSSYMIPFVLDAPPTWSFGYYQDSAGGYQQVS